MYVRHFIIYFSPSVCFGHTKLKKIKYLSHGDKDMGNNIVKNCVFDITLHR